MFIKGRSIRFVHNNPDGSSVNEPSNKVFQLLSNFSFGCLNKDVREMALFLKKGAVK